MTTTPIITTLGTVVNAEEALKRLAEARLPVKAAYHVAKLLRLVAEEAKVFHEQREAAIRELGEERDATPAEAASAPGGKVVSVTPANVPAFAHRLQELAALAVTIPWSPLDLAVVGDLNITPADLLALDPFVVLTGPVA